MTLLSGCVSFQLRMINLIPQLLPRHTVFANIVKKYLKFIKKELSAFDIAYYFIIKCFQASYGFKVLHIKYPF